ncbi:Similar to hypothetical protein [Podospora anserina S mat+]; acc. no. XP_001903708 [Pyronema omphalodes CBS 100304]|uniref:Uncharacterized protein n=1 Tax=Pyronema omphalodes (strain CBS 100304) TaxID=1076935 RepID=U4LLM8_PYROM|nr:Similar to hypothetical protein [Podospora anserina S mat+]; acc. no. XP_001903708 [Pyronema omphalodes CBS 100304]
MQLLLPTIILSSISSALAQSVSLYVCEHKDFGGTCSNNLPKDNHCYNLEETNDFLDNQISSYRVSGGCCVFYDQYGCNMRDHLFSATNRQHGKIGSWHNDKISSIKCDKICRFD